MIDDNFIKNLYQYTRKRINFLFPGIDINYMDISHSVIADERFSIENWRDLVDRLIYDEVSFIKIGIMWKVSLNFSIPKHLQGNTY